MGRRSPIEHRAAVCELLRRLRSDANLTQEAVADQLDRPQSYVSKYETGERRLDILELREVLKALGTNLDAFVDSLERRLRRIGPGTPPQPW